MLAWGVFLFIVVVDLVASLSGAFSFFSWYTVLIEFPMSYMHIEVLASQLPCMPILIVLAWVHAFL